MRKLKLVLEYDGTAYHGWQKQANAVGIQNVLEKNLKVLLREEVSTSGAGRTDAGVHARMQVASFATHAPVPCKDLLRGLNGLLPRDIRVTACEEAPEVFDARHDPEEKTYRYFWHNRPVESPFHRRTACFVRQPLHLASMRESAQCLVGRHDFSSFRAADCQAEHPRREVKRLSLDWEGELAVLSITADAFLHHMVRIIAGTLQEVGVGKRRVEEMAHILGAKDRKAAGLTAPARGLFLWEVKYGQIPRPGRLAKAEQLALDRARAAS
jgi:tRNA pseudouridine38-40 synthase